MKNKFSKKEKQSEEQPMTAIAACSTCNGKGFLNSEGIPQRKPAGIATAWEKCSLQSSLRLLQNFHGITIKYSDLCLMLVGITNMACADAGTPE